MNISVKGVSKIYKAGKCALDNISLEIQGNNMIGLLGPNGAGKSTLMKLLTAGLLPTSGEILIDGESMQKKEKMLKSRLGYLPQSFGLYDELTVWQFLDYMAALKGIRCPKDEISKIIEETNLTEKYNAKIKTLSGGQRQRVGIAQALIGNPGLVILDEPTVGLDPEERIKFRNLFSRNSQEKIVILSTHIIDDVQSICDRLIVIDKGKILFDGSPAELIVLARGHVGTFIQNGVAINKDIIVTAQVNTTEGISCRVVSESLPEFAIPAEPSLEDAYMFLIQRGK